MQSFESAVISEYTKRPVRHDAVTQQATQRQPDEDRHPDSPRPRNHHQHHRDQQPEHSEVAKARDEAHEPVQHRIMQPLNRIENSQFHFLTPHSIPPVYHLPAPSDSHSVRTRFPHFRKCRAPVPEWFPLTSIQCYNDIRYIHPGSDRNDKRSRNIAAEEEEAKA